MPQDNDGKAPLIPAGTGKDMYGQIKPMYQPEGGQAAPAPQAKDGQNPQAPVTDAPQGTTFEQLAAKKGFKSADDLARSYEQLESSHTKKSMDLAELMEAKNPKQEPVIQEAQRNLQDQGYTPEQALDIVRKLVQDEIAPVREQLALRDTFKNQEDMQYAPAVAEIVKKNPSIPWDVALKAAKYDSVQSQLTEVTTQNKQQDILTKEKAQAGSQGSGIKPQQNLQQLVSDKEVPFRDVQKIMRERFSQR